MNVNQNWCILCMPMQAIAVTEITLHANDELLCLLLCIVMTQDNNWRASDQPGVRPGQCAEHMVECDQYG